MREDCLHFQSRSYDDGETARFCTLDLAPEAPWRCPDGCHGYERLAIATGLVEGSLARPPVEPEPDAAPDDIAAVLDDAEDVVNAAAPAVIAELQAKPSPWWRRLGRREPRDGGPSGLSQR
jgi:hypothetical protein